MKWNRRGPISSLHRVRTLYLQNALRIHYFNIISLFPCIIYLGTPKGKHNVLLEFIHLKENNFTLKCMLT